MVANNEMKKVWNTVMVHFEVLYRNLSGGTEKIVTIIGMVLVPVKIRTGSLPITVTNLTSCVNLLVGFERIIEFIRRGFRSR
jgi:hypothetical protein